ncbi:MAG TPA: hypothetical protein VGS28_01530 [Candidatus Saccharimonadales bacterium]|nr:hypothetical protein [Candidatus Saccharimonadales bacterium]
MSLEYRGGLIPVVNLAGGPCAGKGLQAQALAELGGETFETGQSYRLLGLELSRLVGVEFGMPFAEVERRVHTLGGQAIGELVAGVGTAIGQQGRDFLYTSDASALSATVSPHGLVRRYVKADLRHRVGAVAEAIRQGDTDTTFIVLDGRRLPEAIDHGDEIEGPVEGLRIVTDIFSDIHPIVAALRDCARRRIGLPVAGEEALPFEETELGKAYHKALVRARDDVERDLDKNVPQANALPYCSHHEAPFDVDGLVGLALASGLGNNIEPLVSLGIRASIPVCRLREGMGRRAFLEGRQLLLNTSRMRPNVVRRVVQAAFMESVDAAVESGALESAAV